MSQRFIFLYLIHIIPESSDSFSPKKNLRTHKAISPETQDSAPLPAKVDCRKAAPIPLSKTVFSLALGDYNLVVFFSGATQQLEKR